MSLCPVEPPPLISPTWATRAACDQPVEQASQQLGPGLSHWLPFPRPLVTQQRCSRSSVPPKRDKRVGSTLSGSNFSAEIHTGTRRGPESCRSLRTPYAPGLQLSTSPLLQAGKLRPGSWGRSGGRSLGDRQGLSPGPRAHTALLSGHTMPTGGGHRSESPFTRGMTLCEFNRNQLFHGI